MEILYINIGDNKYIMSLTSRLTIGALRQLVPQKQAWRELLSREEFFKLYKRYKNYDMHYVDSITTSGQKIYTGDIRLKDTIKGKCISFEPYNSEMHIYANNITLYDKDITFSNIVKKLNDFERKAVAARKVPRSLDELEPKMLQKLFSDKYKPTRRFNEEGYHVTTVIDRQTQEPVEVFIKLKSVAPDPPIHSGSGFLTRFLKTDSRIEEIYRMYVKNPKGKPELIGDRSFKLDTEKGVIAPGNMQAYGNDRYEGIGTRLHQLAVERMMQNDYKAVELCSVSKAFPFHYKSLFRVESHPELNSDFHTIITKFKTINPRLVKEGYKPLSDDELISCLVETSQKGVFDFSKSYENILKLMFQKSIPPIGDTPMILDGKNLEYWKELAKNQPILLK